MDMISYKTWMGNTKLGAYKLISLDKIPSTQDVAHDLIAAGRAKDKTVITATVQTAGRGRYRRTWVSHVGNLYASFLYKIRKPNPELSYAVAVAVAEALIHFGLLVQIKWPNDVLVNGKKISGILIEYSNNFVIVGIGINVAHAPRLLGYPTAKINDFTNVNLADLFGALIKKLDFWRDQDFEIVRKRWLDLAIGVNQKIKYRGQDMNLVGLGANGALILNDGARDIHVYGDEIML